MPSGWYETRLMLMRRWPMAGPVCLAAVLGAGLPAAAADLQPHAITYSITVEKPPPDTWLDAQISVTLTKTCDGWGYSSAWVYGIERNTRGDKPPGQPLGPGADNWQERLKFTEKLDGSSLVYDGNYQRNGRGEDARGIVTPATSGKGTMEVKSDRLPRKIELPAGTLLPLTLRGKLIDALRASEPDKPRATLEVRTVELGRFFTATDVKLGPAAPLPQLRQGRDLVPRFRSPLLTGRGWAVKQTSNALADWMESTFELYENGIIPRFTFKREGIVWRADVKELSAFTAPKCGG